MREEIARRQLADAPPPGSPPRAWRFFAARCLVRYAQEARLAGDAAQAERFVRHASSMRESAKGGGT